MPTVGDRRCALRDALGQVSAPSLHHVLDLVYTSGYSGPVVLQCVNGVPQVVELPHVEAFARVPLDKFRGRSQTA